MYKLASAGLVILLVTGFVSVAQADSQAGYEQMRDQMLQKGASDKKAEKFSAAEKKLMQDSMAQAKKDLPEPGLKVGDKAPDFTLEDAFGKKVSLASVLQKGPVILVFYRGAWCPFCNLHLHVLQKNIAEFAKYNATLIAVTPQLPDESAKQIKAKKYPFEVLSDLDDKVMKAYGLYYKVPDELIALYKRKGLDIEHYNGKGRVAIPIPGTYVIGKNGIIKAVHAQHDYKERMEPSAIIEVLKQ